MSTSSLKAAATDEAATTLHIERIFAAPIERVFQAWTDPEHLAKWWGPKNCTSEILHLDLRPGGRWETIINTGDCDVHHVGGEYVEISQPHRLVFTWAWVKDGVPGHQTQVSIDLETLGEKTRMVFRQDVFESMAMRDQHDGGWQSSLDCLGEHLAGRG